MNKPTVKWAHIKALGGPQEGDPFPWPKSIKDASFDQILLPESGPLVLRVLWRNLCPQHKIGSLVVPYLFRHADQWWLATPTHLPVKLGHGTVSDPCEALATIVARRVEDLGKASRDKSKAPNAEELDGSVAGIVEAHDRLIAAHAKTFRECFLIPFCDRNMLAFRKTAIYYIFVEHGGKRTVVTPESMCDLTGDDSSWIFDLLNRQLGPELRLYDVLEGYTPKGFHDEPEATEEGADYP